jgi:acyl carrier protein
MGSLEQQIKVKLVETLELELSPDQIDDERPLFGEQGLGLDSVDVLEVVAMLQMEYQVEIPDRETATRVLVNVRTIADFVRARPQPQPG